MIILNLTKCLTLASIYLSMAVSSSPSNCPLPGQVSCGHGSLPNFCCPASHKCVQLAGNTTILCCPVDSDCSMIKPVSCDINLQNVTSHPDAAIKTNALGVSLQKCASKCCPFGYTCNSAGNCAENADQSLPPGLLLPATLSPTPSVAASSILESTAFTSTYSPLPTSSALQLTSSSRNSCLDHTARAIVAGFFPGLIVGLMLAASIFAWVVTWRRRKEKSPHSTPFGRISQPRLIGDLRSDFLRKQPQFPKTFVNGPLEKRSSIFSQSPSYATNLESGGRGISQQTLLPLVPLKIRRSFRRQSRTDTPLKLCDSDLSDLSLYDDLTHTAADSIASQRDTTLQDFLESPIEVSKKIQLSRKPADGLGCVASSTQISGQQSISIPTVKPVMANYSAQESPRDWSPTSQARHGYA
ncbi:unnamed protein product [Blumeria hordei]|uniref:Uncharacterized protein n=1 Tax=Blumeria hordei TaxID=2867405 RepID=A0A383UTV7_BLUHO|nr:unnamed protein product [Blumeria hordei]